MESVIEGTSFVVETDHRNLTNIHLGTSANISRWFLLLQSLSFSISFIAGTLNVIADALGRAPRGLTKALHALRLSDFFSTSAPGRFASSRAVKLSALPEEQARAWFFQHHNDTIGHFALHAMMWKLTPLTMCSPVCLAISRIGLHSVPPVKRIV